MGSDALRAGRSAVSVLTATGWCSGQSQGGAGWWGGGGVETSVTDWQACVGILLGVKGGKRADMKIKAQQDWDAGGRVRWEGQSCIYHVCLFGIIKEEKAGAKSQTSMEISITSQRFISLCRSWSWQACLVLQKGKPWWQMPPMRTEGREHSSTRSNHTECVPLPGPVEMLPRRETTAWRGGKAL